MSYHAQRPAPKGKLIMHFIATPVIEVAADGKTARGQWVMSGIESGLTSLEAAKGAPDFMYEKELVDGMKDCGFKLTYANGTLDIAAWDLGAPAHLSFTAPNDIYVGVYPSGDPPLTLLE